MLTDAQIKEILSCLEFDGRFYRYTANSQEIWESLDEIDPYVTGYTRMVRSFKCDGLSSLGHKLIK